MYEKNEVIINFNSPSIIAKVWRSVREVCPLSPTLFNLYIKKAINKIKLWLNKKEIRVKIGRKLISMLFFADDIVVLVASEEDLQTMIYRYNESHVHRI